MRLIQAGRSEAIEAIYDRYASPLLGYLFHTVGNIDEAHDLVHEAVLALVKAAPAYEYPRPVRPWFFAIARNLALNFLKKARPRLSLDADPEEGGALKEALLAAGPTPEAAVRQGEEREELKAALGCLSPAEREIVFLRLGEGLRPREIADIVGTSVEAARQRMTRAIRRLRESMSGPP